MTPVTQAISTALLHFIWQGIVGGIILAIVLSALRKSSANSRYVASCVVLAALALSPVVTGWIVYRSAALSSSPVTTAVRTNSVGGIVVSDASPVEQARSVDFKIWVLPLWAAGVVAFALRLAWACGHASSLRREGVAADASLQSMIQNLAERSGIRRTIRVLMSSLADVPSVVGWFRPVVLLPAALVTGLSPQQLEALIAHELAHVRRHDYFVNILQMVVETLLFYHPVVWWVSSRIRYERELCCDDLAVRCCGDVVSYARALAQLERLRSSGPTLVMGSATGSVFDRIQRLLGQGRIEYGPSKLVCGIGLVIGVLSLGFFMSNARAQQEEPIVPLPAIQAFPAVPAIAPVAPVPLAPPTPPTAAAVALPTLQDITVAPVVAPPAPPAPPIPPTQAFAPTSVAPVLQIPTAPPAPPAPRLPQTVSTLQEGVHWVLFKGNDVIVRGNSADEDEARLARRSFSGDLLWFKLEGKAYVSQDPEVLSRVQTAPSTTVDFLSQQLEQLAATRRQENAQTDVLSSRLREVDLAVRQMNDLVSRIRSTAANNPENLEDARARLNSTEAQSRRLQAELAQTEAAMKALQAQIKDLEAAQRNLVLTRALNLGIFRDAVSSGKAQPVP